MSKLLSSLGLGRRKTDSPKTGLSPGGPTPGRHEVPPHEMAHSRNNQENIMFEGGSRDPSFITRENITRSPVVRPIVPAVMPPAHLSPQDAQNWIFTQSLEAQYEYHVYQHEKYIADARAQQNQVNQQIQQLKAIAIRSSAQQQQLLELQHTLDIQGSEIERVSGQLDAMKKLGVPKKEDIEQQQKQQQQQKSPPSHRPIPAGYTEEAPPAAAATTTTTPPKVQPSGSLRTASAEELLNMFSSDAPPTNISLGRTSPPAAVAAAAQGIQGPRRGSTNGFVPGATRQEQQQQQQQQQHAASIPGAGVSTPPPSTNLHPASPPAAANAYELVEPAAIAKPAAYNISPRAEVPGHDEFRASVPPLAATEPSFKVSPSNSGKLLMQNPLVSTPPPAQALGEAGLPGSAGSPGGGMGGHRQVCCPVCALPFEPPSTAGGSEGRVPRLLPSCLHTVCHSCILASEDGKCPMGDGSTMSVPTSLPHDCLMLSKMASQSLREGTAKHTCNLCGEGEAATHHCGVCYIFLCDLHAQAHHRAKDTNSHHVVPASSLAHAPPRPEDAPPPFCKVAGHTDKRMELYCLMCEELACDKCALAMHSTHVIMDHSQAVVGQRRDVEAEIAVCSARGKTLGDGTAACQARIDSLKANADRAKEAADALIDEVIVELEARRAALHEAVDRIHASKQEVLVEHKRSLAGAQMRVNSSGDYASRLLQGGCSVSQLLAIKRHVVGGMRDTQRSAPTDLVPPVDDLVDFRPSGKDEVGTWVSGLGHVGAEKLRLRQFAAKWDVNRKGADVVLSGGDATAYRCTARGWSGVVGTEALSSGKCSVNFRIDHLSQHVLVGLALQGADMQDGPTKLNIVIRETGELTVWGNRLGVLSGFKAGDVIRFLVDFTAKEVQILRNGDKKAESTIVGIPSAPLKPFACFGAVNSSVTLVTSPAET